MTVSVLVARLNRKLRPEEKVEIAVNMSDVCVRICAEGISDQNPSIKEKHIVETVRKRILRQKPDHYEV